MKKNVYIHITESLLLYSRNYHNIVNQLYFNKINLKEYGIANECAFIKV